MRILILGGDGMLGHQLFRHLSERHDVCATLRLDRETYDRYGLFDHRKAFFGIEVRGEGLVSHVIEQYRPHAVVNAIGIVKQRLEAQEVIPSLEINSLFPHRLAQACRSVEARLIHFSTDCVFTGRKGHYRETDEPDADTLYGRTKLLGEVVEPHCLTIRTSMIGPELSRKSGLLEWFLAQSGRTVQGFDKAIFSGFPTRELARIVELVLVDTPTLHGMYHVAGPPISKYELLIRIRDRLRLPITIERDVTFECDRSLNADCFQKATGYSAPSWDVMINDMASQMTEGDL